MSFNAFKQGVSVNNIDKVMNGLIGINSMYGKTLAFSTFKEFDEFMLGDNHFKF